MGEVRDAAITLSNSIIGVAILAMPYCYAQCGFVLATLLLTLSGLATVQSCRMLLKSALATKRRSYEFLAHHVYGPLGKLTVEFGLIGLSIGTLVAFFVIIGDLCPQVLASLMRLPPALVEAPATRAVVMATIAVCVILPLSLMRDPSALSKISAASLMFYAIFMLHLTCLAVFGVGGDSGSGSGTFDQPPAAVASQPYRFFRIDGLLTCLPIFSLAFTCQTQLFLLCDSLSDPSIKVMRRILNLSVFGCCAFYILIGSLGYLAFSSSPAIQGDLMTMYPATPASDLIKLGFVLSVAVSFPIIAFPCRVSIYSFIYLQHHHKSGAAGIAPSDITTGRVFIPDSKFRSITSVIVLGTLIGGLLIPNVEFILSLTGAVTGSVICYILPAGIYLNTFSGDRRRCCSLGCVVKWLGVAILCVGTAATLFGHGGGGSESSANFLTQPPPRLVQKRPPPPLLLLGTSSTTAAAGRQSAPPPKLMQEGKKLGNSESRQEPPLPDFDRESDLNGRLKGKLGHQAANRQVNKAKPTSATTSTSISTVKSTLESKATSTLKPTLKTTLKPKSKPTLKPTSNPTIETKLNSTSYPTLKTTLNPTLKTTLNPTLKTTLNSTLKTTLNATLESTASASSKLTSTPLASNQTTHKAADLEVLARLLREQREQGRRIEEQLRRLEAVNADRHRERRDSADTAPKNDSLTSLAASNSTTATTKAVVNSNSSATALNSSVGLKNQTVA